jgi:hypothetical protein
MKRFEVVNPGDARLNFSRIVQPLGRNLQMPDWAAVMLAGANGALGELAMALLVACLTGARVLWMGTGATRVDAVTRANWHGDWQWPELVDGTPESVFMAEALFVNWDRVAALPAFRPWQAELAKLHSNLRCYLDVTTVNTEQEIEFAGRRAAAQIRYMVAPPSHVPRASVVADVLRENGLFSGEVVGWVSSQVCFPGTTAGDVSIVEPVHLPGHSANPARQREPAELIPLVGKLLVASLLAKPGPEFLRGLAEDLIPCAEKLDIQALALRKPITAQCLQDTIKNVTEILKS